MHGLHPGGDVGAGDLVRALVGEAGEIAPGVTVGAAGVGGADGFQPELEGGGPMVDFWPGIEVRGEHEKTSRQ